MRKDDLQRAHQLVAVERHPAAVALDDGEFAQLHPLEGGEAEIAGDADPPPPDHGGILGRTRVLHLRIETVAAWATHLDLTQTLLINREAIGERLDPFLDRGFDQRRLAVRRLRDGVEHLGDQAADLLEFGDAEAARGRRRRAEPEARGDERLFRIERNAVLVAGDAPRAPAPSRRRCP